MNTAHERKSRIALTSFYLPGGSKIGVGYQVHAFANELVRRGHDVTVFSHDPPGDGASYRSIQIDSGTSQRGMRFAWRLRRVDWSQFDVLHAHGDDHFLAGVRRPPHLRTVHGSCFSEARHIPGWKNKLRMAVIGVFEVFSTAVVADHSVAVSGATRTTYPWVEEVVPNGIDLDRFAGERSLSAVPTILFVGTYENRKRGRLLVESFDREVRPTVPDAELWMVCQDAPTSPQVEVLGRLTDEELADRYRHAWVFCLPSSYEGFGIPYAEAMAAGCPVVATPNPGALEVLDGGNLGVIAEPADLGRELVALLEDPERRAAASRRGTDAAVRFGWDAVLGRYEALYGSVRRRPLTDKLGRLRRAVSPRSP